MSRRGTRWRPSSMQRDARIARSATRGRSSKRIRSSPTRGTSSGKSCSRAARWTRRRCTSKRPPAPRRRTRTSITSWRGRTKRSDAPSSLKRNSRSIATSKTSSGVRRRDAAKACAGAAALDRRRASCQRARVRPGCRCRNAVGPRTAADGARARARSRAGKHRRPGRACGSRSGPRRARAGGRSRAPRAPTRRGASDGEPRDGHRLDETRTLRRGARGAGQGDRGEPGFAGRALSIEPSVRATRRRGERKATRAVVPAETARGGRTDEDTARRHVQRKIAVMRSVVALAGAVAAGALALAASQPVLFRDITAEAGITFQHHAAPEKKYIVESMSGGVALFDYDRDGLLDIYFVDSLTVATAKDPTAARSALYRNLGNGKFADVTDKSGLAHPGWGMGVCTADVDGDGWEDLYVTGLGKNRLYRNNHDGTFTDIAEQAGGCGRGWFG